MTNPLGHVYRAGTVAGSDALRLGEAMLAAFVWTLIEWTARTGDGRSWAVWVDPIALGALGVALIMLAGVLDAIPGYGARNTAAFLLLTVWVAVGMIARTGHDTGYQMGVSVGWIAVLMVCTFALGNGKFAASHPIIGALHQTVREARGDVAGAVKGLAVAAQSDPRALAQLELLTSDCARAVMAIDPSAGVRLVGVISDLVRGTKPVPGSSAFGSVDHRGRAQGVVERQARAALLSGDRGMLDAVWGSVVDLVGLPAGTLLSGVVLSGSGPVVSFRPPAGVDGAAVKVEVVRSVLAGLCRVPESVVRVSVSAGVVSVALKVDVSADDPGDF